MPVRPFADAPIPVSDLMVNQPRPQVTKDGGEDKLAGLCSQPWNEWFSLLAGQLNASPFIQNGVSLDSQGASIGATDFTGGALSGGLYRLSYYVQVTRAATTSSSIQVTLAWTFNGATVTFPGTVLTGNTLTTGTSQQVMVRIDAGSPVTYATTYASVGATSMLYSLNVTIEQLPV